jgi:hypothetical protein
MLERLSSGLVRRGLPAPDDYGRDGRLLRVPATGTSEKILERSLTGLHERSPSGQT